MFNILRCSDCCRLSRTWITFNRFSTLFEVFVPPFYLPCTHCIFPESFLNPPNSFRGGMFKLNTKFDVDSLLYLLILNVMATQYTCSLNSIYRPHWLVQWSRHCSPMCIPVHSPWCQVTLTLHKPFSLYKQRLDFFLEWPHKCMYIYVCMYVCTHCSWQEINSEMS